MDDLEARNADLATALQQADAARAEAIEATEARDRFFANLTHEIRTPLNGIAGHGRSPPAHAARRRPGAARRGAGREHDEPRRCWSTPCSTTHASGRARGGRTAPDGRRAWRRRTWTACSVPRRPPRAWTSRVTVADDVPAWIELDVIKVRQVVHNLVGNAIKFTPRGRVLVTVAAIPRRRDPGHRAAAPAGRRHGWGHRAGAGRLRLRAVRPGRRLHLAGLRRHGAGARDRRPSWRPCWVGRSPWKARLGEGSTFTLTVPYASCEAPTPAVAPPAAPEPSRRTGRRAPGAGRRGQRDQPGGGLADARVPQAEVALAENGMPRGGRWPADGDFDLDPHGSPDAGHGRHRGGPPDPCPRDHDRVATACRSSR